MKRNVRKLKANSAGIENPATIPHHDTETRQYLPLHTELLHQVCSKLTTSEVGVFRLACKSFAAIGEEHLVEELCFFFQPRSIAKVIEVSQSAHATHVKTLVFEDVQITSWDQMHHRLEVRFPRKNREPNPLQSASSDHDAVQQTYCENHLGELLGDAVLRFSNLKGIHSHAGFKDPRPVVPIISLKVLLQSRQQSLHRLAKLLWDDRASLRIWSFPDPYEDPEEVTDVDDHICSYWQLAKRAFKVEGNQPDAAAVLPKLRTLGIPAATGDGLIQQDIYNALDCDNILKHVVLHYDATT